MSVAGDLIYVDFNINNPAGQAVDADSLPTATLVKNGIDTAVTVTVTNKETGVYNAAVTLPSDAEAGDLYQIRIEAVVSSQTSKAVIYQEVIGGAYSELTITFDFITQNISGTAQDADSTPTVVFARNAVDYPDVITVTNKETGVYTASGKIPVGFKDGDELQVRAEVVVDSVTGKDNILLATLVDPPVTETNVYVSYVTIQEAQTYFQYKLHETAWSQATPTERQNSLIEATRIVDSLNFKGMKNAVYDLLQDCPDATDAQIRTANASQLLEFPRGADTTVPERIKWACYEIAYSLLDGVDPEFELENMSMNDHGIGSVRASFNRNQTPLEHFMNGVPSAIGWKYLRPFLRDDKHRKLARVS